MNNGDDKASSAFADSSLILNDNQILYVNSTYGLMLYDYATRDAQDGGERGEKILYSSEKMKTATLDFVNNGKLYFHDSDSYLYRLDISVLLDDNKGNDDVSEYRLTSLAIDTSWFAPEIINANGKEMLMTVYSDSKYHSYVYSLDMSAVEKGYDDMIKALSEDDDKNEAISKYYEVKTMKDDEFLAEVKKTIVGVLSDSDLETLTPKDSSSNK
ncbi:MAG: hypothetical protein MJ072_04615 [Clostridia bacterium]|nr:hypothetical protein [Clostridia bacterium]